MNRASRGLYDIGRHQSLLIGFTCIARQTGPEATGYWLPATEGIYYAWSFELNRNEKHGGHDLRYVQK